MPTPKEIYYEKNAETLIKKLESRHFEACYCATKEEAVQKVLELIPEGSSIGWGGMTSAHEIGLFDALREKTYTLIDRDTAKSPAEREEIQRKCFYADFFLMSANAISMDGQMVNIDGGGNRVAALCWGPKNVIVVAGMNKVEPTLEEAISRARNVAAPINTVRLHRNTPCTVTGACADCKSDECICSQIVITRNSLAKGRIKFVLVGEDIGY